jgi:hypothetical protein
MIDPPRYQDGRKRDDGEQVTEGELGHGGIIAKIEQCGRCGKRRPPAAMMAGVTDRLWSFQDLFEELVVRA